MAKTVKLYTSNFHDCDKSNGISSDDLEPYVTSSYSDALGHVFDYVEQRLLHACPDLFREEVLECPDMNVDELIAVLKEANQDDQLRYCEWYFSTQNDTETTAAFSIQEHEVDIA